MKIRFLSNTPCIINSLPPSPPKALAIRQRMCDPGKERQRMMMLKMATKLFKAVFALLILLTSEIYQYQTLGNDRTFSAKDVIVLDNLFTANDLKHLRFVLSHENTFWSFKPYIDDNHPFTSTSHLWSARLDLDTFGNSSVWKKIESALVKSRDESPSLFPYKSEGQIGVRGNHVRVTSCNREGYLATVFLAENWSPNWYGEMIVYNNTGEIMKAVVPRYGRLAVIPCSLNYVIKPPALDILQRFHSLTIFIESLQLDKHVNYHKTTQESTKEIFKEKDYLRKFGLLTSIPSCPTKRLEVEKYITSRFTTADGRNVLVLDNVFPGQITDALAYTVSNGVYADNPAEAGSTDNVQWILGFEVHDFLKTPLWPVINDIVTYASGRDSYYPYDIGCNNLQGADSPTIHRDCAVTEDEYTFLIYLNPNWTESLHGETIFFTDIDGSDFAFAVKPKYGRAALFHGTIPHSGRPPPLMYQGKHSVNHSN